MTQRERWIVYPLLSLALGAVLKDKLVPPRILRADQIVCNSMACERQLHTARLKTGHIGIVNQANGQEITVLTLGVSKEKYKEIVRPVGRIDVRGPDGTKTTLAGSRIESEFLFVSRIAHAKTMLSDFLSTFHLNGEPMGYDEIEPPAQADQEVSIPQAADSRSEEEEANGEKDDSSPAP